MGDVKLRTFGPVHTEEVAPPLRNLGRPAGGGDEESGAEPARLTLVGVYANERKSFGAEIDRARVPAGTWEWVRRALTDMQRKFWGWRVDLGRFSDEAAAAGVVAGGVDVGEVLALSADFLSEIAAGRAWLQAFQDAQDALRFCLSCCVELAYSPSGMHAWRGGSGETTPDGASLWSGPPVGFTMHAVERDTASAAGLPEAIRRLECRSLGASQEEHMEVRVGPGLLEMLALTRLLPAGCRVVLSGTAWACLNKGLGGQPAHFGMAVLEHLGRVQVACLGRPWEVYQMLPVQLAARSSHFASLRDVAPGRLSLAAPGARDAPQLALGLTFTFTRWFEPSERDLRALELSRGKGSGGGGGGC